MEQTDGNRLEDFRQFREDIRGSKEHLLVGIDVAKDKHYAFFGTAAGKTLYRRLVFENSLEGFRKLLAQGEAMRVEEGLSQVVFGMEPTGNYHKPLGEHLIRCGHRVVLVSGVAAHENRKTLDGRWDTNDTRDAANVIEEKIEEVCSQIPGYEYLLTIPGFGPDVSAKVLGALGEPFRFRNGRQVLKLAGLDLSAERSGKTSEKAIPVISKKGKGDLRYALYQAVFIASTRNVDFIRYYRDQLRGREREPGIKTKVRVKLSAKLLLIAWTLMRKGEPFQPSFLQGRFPSSSAVEGRKP